MPDTPMPDNLTFDILRQWVKALAVQKGVGDEVTFMCNDLARLHILDTLQEGQGMCRNCCFVYERGVYKCPECGEDFTR
jgi:hypothetical protein